MQLAVSQIAWQPEDECRALQVLHAAGFGALEIVPARVAKAPPWYKRPEQAAGFAARLHSLYGMRVCSMQSIWYGCAGNVFGAGENALLHCTGQAAAFARAAACPGMVFGCPKNRTLSAGQTAESVLPVLKRLAALCQAQGVVLALEALPPQYGTNFANTTSEALRIVQMVGSPAFKLNLDIATMLACGEDATVIKGQTGLVAHVHVSEPQLALIQKHPLHAQVARVLRGEGYAKAVSVEMKAQSIKALEGAVAYVAEVFG